MRTKLKTLALIASLIIIGMLTSCEPKEKDFECSYISFCSSAEFSIVNYHTLENMIGKNPLIHPIHPDSIFILNDRLDTMFTDVRNFQDLFYYVTRFNPFHEITCFNQCLSDSAFSRYYYLYVGKGDFDTVEVHFPAKQRQATFYEFYFNGEEGRYFDETGIHDVLQTQFVFRKKF